MLGGGPLGSAPLAAVAILFTGTGALACSSNLTTDVDATTFVPGVGMPFFVQKGFGVTQGTGPITPAYPDVVSAGQIALMPVQTANETLSVPAGWAHVDGSPQGTGTPGAAGSVGGNLLWQRLNGTEGGTTVSVGDTGNHTVARIFTFQDAIATGQPWITNEAVGDIQAVAQTLIEIPGRTTTVPNCLAVLFAFHAIDTSAAHVVSGEVNTDLSDTIGLTELNVITGTGGGFWLSVGGKATPGTFGLTTAQFSDPTKQSHLVVVLRPEPPGITGTGALTGSSKAAGTGTALLGVTGTGALRQASFSSDGDGTSQASVGSGILAVSGHKVTGTGTYTPQAITGSGSLRNAGAHLGAVGGAGASVANGSLAVTGAKVSGTGTYTQATIFGTGSLGVVPTMFASDVAGTAYYVSNKPGEVGNDANSGLSQLLPKLTLASLAPTTAFLSFGDTVYGNCGSRFPETLPIKTVGNVGGVAGYPVTYRSYGTGIRPMVSGANIESFVFDQAVAGGHRYKHVGALGYFPNQAWVETGTTGTGTVRNLLPQSASIAATTALDAWRNDTATNTVYVVVGTGQVPGVDVTIHLGARNSNVVPTTGGECYITLQDWIYRFTNSTTTQAIQMDQDSQAANGWVFDNTLVEWTNGNGMRFGGQGTNDYSQPRLLTMRNAVFRYCRDSGCQANYLTPGSLIDGCSFYGNGRQGFGFAMYRGTVQNSTFDYNANALDKWTASSSVQSYDDGCRVVGSSPPGAPNWIPAGENLIVDCSATGNGRKGFATDVMSNNNIFLRIVSRLNGIFGLFFEGGTDSSAYGNAVYHSTFWGNLGAGFAVYNGHGGFTCKNCQIYGNCTNGNAQDVTIGFTLGTLTATWPVHAGNIYKHEHMLYDPIDFKADSDLLTRVANVAAMTAGTWCYVGETVYAWKPDSSAVILGWTNPAWEMDYNNYTPVGDLTDGHNIFGYGSATTGLISGLLTSIRSTFGQELNGQQVNPQYVDAPNGNFRLISPTSPSIDAGVVVPGINDGTGGSRAYVGDAPDIGAFEAPAIIYGPIPTVDQVGTEVSGTAGVTVAWPPHQAGRIGILVAATCQEAVPTPSGWTLVAYKGNGPAGSPTSAGLTMWWQRATSSSMPNVVLADPGDHVVAVIFTVQDCIDTGDPVNVSGTSAASFTTAVSAPGLATTTRNCLVVAGVANTADTLMPQTSGWANSDLADPPITAVVNVNTNQGNGSGFGVAVGGWAAKGTFGATTATLATSSSQGKIVFALRPNLFALATGTGGLAAIPKVAALGVGVAVGSGTLRTASHSVAGTGTYIPKPITGTGTLSLSGATVAASGVAIAQGTAVLRVLGSVAATGTYTPQAITGTATLGAIPSSAGTAASVFTGTATLAATSKAAATGTLASAGTGTLAAIPTVTATGTLRFTGTATLGATSKVTATAASVFSGTGALALSATTAQGCLSQTGNLITLSGVQPQLDTRNAADGGSGNSVTPPNTKYNATSATWTGINDYAVVLGNGTSTGVCWHGGVLTNTLDPNTTPWDTWHSTGGILFFPPSGCIEDVKIVNYGDGIRIQDLAANFTIRRCHLVECHDDAIENDRQHSGIIDDCLIEGCFVFLSTRPGANTLPRDSSNDVMTISNSLVWQKPMNFPEGCRLASATPPCTGPFWKWAADNTGPQVVVTNSIFRIDQFPSNGDLDFPPDMGVCSGNTIVWLGGGAYPATLPPGFTVVTDVNVWNAAAAAWKATHPLVNGASLTGTGLLTSTSAGALSVVGKVAGTGTYTAVAITGAATLRQAGAASSAVGSEGFTGTGSPKVLGSVAGTGTALFGVTGSGGLGARSAAAGSGSQTAQGITGTGVLGASSAVLGIGTEVLTGTVVLAVSGHTLAATGSYTPKAITGTSVLAQGGATVLGSGVQTSAGQAILAVQGAVSGIGTNTPVAITGTGNCSADGASVTASGVQTSVGTSTLSATTAVLASGGQTFIGTATLGVSPTVTGTGNDVLTGTGALTASPFTVVGDATQAFRGALGARVLLDGTGELVFTGDAQVGVSAIAAWLGSQVSGTGAQTFSGDGTLELDDWGIDAGGESGSLGQAGIAVAEPAVQGTGSTYLDLSGSLTATKASVAGSGSALIMVIDASVQLKDRSGPHYCITDANSRHRKRRTC